MNKYKWAKCYNNNEYSSLTKDISTVCVFIVINNILNIWETWDKLSCMVAIALSNIGREIITHESTALTWEIQWSSVEKEATVWYRSSCKWNVNSNIIGQIFQLNLRVVIRVDFKVNNSWAEVFSNWIKLESASFGVRDTKFQSRLSGSTCNLCRDWNFWKRSVSWKQVITNCIIGIFWFI